VNTVTIYHNPACSKSRDTLAFLEARGFRPRIIRYLETPLTEAEIGELLRQLGIAASSLIRAPDFHRLGFQPTSDQDQLIELIAKYPILMQRPIVVVDGRARIAKQPDVLDGFLPPPDSVDVEPE
jgi:arsenate reductase (glutaredoxin)